MARRLLHAGKSIAIPYSESYSGASFLLPDGSHAFLYRDKEDHLFRSTSVFISKDGFVKQAGNWTELATRIKFEEANRTFGDGVEQLKGFDTFWYNWSLNNPKTEVLAAEYSTGSPWTPRASRRRLLPLRFSDESFLNVS